MSNETYNRNERIYSELEPWVERIIECYDRSMSILACIEFLKKEFHAFFETEDLNNDSQFLEIARQVLWKALDDRAKRDQSYEVPSFNYLFFADDQAYFKNILRPRVAQSLLNEDAWKLSWFPNHYQKLIEESMKR